MYNILIADDDVVDLLAMERLLANFNVTTASNLKEISKLVKKMDFHCIVIDCFLGLDNLGDFIYSLKAECPVIAITGLGDERLAVSLLKKGCHDYIAKANMNEDLCKKVESACKLYVNEQSICHVLRNTAETVSGLCKDIEQRLTKYKICD